GAAGHDALAGVHYLRTLGDAQLLRQELHAATRVVAIGAGFLGCEVAASAASLGKHVMLVSRGALPLLRVLGHEMAAVYRDLHTENGTHVVVNARARELRGDHRVESVALADGQVLPADIVFIAIGDEPRTAVAEAAGLKVDNGV